MLSKWKNKASNDFDFNSYEHKRSDKFIDEYINFESNKNKNFGIY